MIFKEFIFFFRSFTLVWPLLSLTAFFFSCALASLTAGKSWQFFYEIPNINNNNSTAHSRAERKHCQSRSDEEQEESGKKIRQNNPLKRNYYYYLRNCIWCDSTIQSIFCIVIIVVIIVIIIISSKRNVIEFLFFPKNRLSFLPFISVEETVWCALMIDEMNNIVVSHSKWSCVSNRIESCVYVCVHLSDPGRFAMQFTHSINVLFINSNELLETLKRINSNSPRPVPFVRPYSRSASATASNVNLRCELKT